MSERFVEAYSQGGFFSTKEIKILVDRMTGVNYIFVHNGNQGAAITPLLNADGKPVVTDIPK